MASRAFFLDQSERFFAALNRFDPLREELVLRSIDPVPRGRLLVKGEGRIPLGRVTLACSAIILPEILSCLSPSQTLGGNFLGEHGMARDLMLWLQFALLTVWLFLIVWVRRLLGALVLELERVGVTQLPKRLDDMSHWNSWAHRKLAWASQMTVKSGIFWIGIFVVFNAAQLVPKLHGNVHDWATSPWSPGTLLAFLHVGDRQPNFAGVWHFAILSAAAGYMMLMIVRLYVGFTYVCSRMAADDSLRIMPNHPDETGGLLPLGKISLVLSLFTLTAGCWMTGLTFFIFGPLEETPTFMFYVLWIAYLVLGPLLFVLPIWPLRQAMVKAKLEYLDNVEQMFAKSEVEHLADIKNHHVDGEALKARADLLELLDHAQEMAVWPFDRVTFRRFAGTLLAPLVPIVGERIWPAFERLLAFLNGRP